jgi:ribosome maturation protein Sdo1
MDEVECILCNLIYKGAVKGYIAHRTKKLVMGTTDPFPIAKLVTPATELQKPIRK